MRIHVALARSACASRSTPRRGLLLRRQFVPRHALISLSSTFFLFAGLIATFVTADASIIAVHAAQAPTESPRAGGYLTIVRAYQRGDNEAVVRVAELWRAGTEAERLEMARLVDVVLAPAAIALHLEAAWQALGSNADEQVTAHLRQAGAIAQADQVKQAASTRAVRRDYYVLAAWMYAVTSTADVIWRHLQLGKQAFPEDPELALAEGSARETTLPLIDDVRRGAAASVAFGSRRTLSPTAAWANWIANQGVIVSLYERAITAPTAETAIEARVRLISLYQRAKRTTPARKARDEAFAAFSKLNGAERQRVRALEYLAHMFAARVASDEEDWAGALREYRIAGLLCTAATAALVGRAHASVMAGREADARETIALTLAVGQHTVGQHEAAASSSAATTPSASATAALIARDRCSGDPWLRYDLGQSWRLQAGMAALRARVRQ